MTGRHSLASPEVGRTDEQRAQVTSRPKLAEALSRAGYATGALSPNPPASSYFGFDEGFDWFEDFLADAGAGPIERTWRRVFEESIEGGGLATYLRLARNVLARDEIMRPWDDFYDEILAWRDRIEEPYFLWVLLLEPHHPWMPPTDVQEWSSRWDKLRAFEHYFRMFSSGFECDFSEEEHDRLVNLYDDSIRHGDRFLARLRSDLAGDDPVVVVHADHGEEFGGHGRYGHQPYLYESLTHVPLVVHGADREGRVDRPVGLRSIATTLADLGGAAHSFPAPSLFEERPWATSKVFAEGDRRAAVRTDAGKYVEGDRRRELYRLAEDPDEQRNRAGEDPAAVDAFAAVLEQDVAGERDHRGLRSAGDRLVEEGRL
jgi:arylsulfatase